MVAQPEQADSIIEAMCVAHHAMRSQQGFTTAPWLGLEERNRQQYREAMKAAVVAMLAIQQGL